MVTHTPSSDITKEIQEPMGAKQVRTKRLNIRITEEDKRKADWLRVERGYKTSDIVRSAIYELYDKEKGE